MRGFRPILFLGIAVLLGILFVLDLMIGAVHISPGDLYEAISSGDGIAATLFYNFRLPKAIVCVLAGAALSASGLQMQTLFRNPLAGPYILGVSSGASLGVAFFLLGIPLLGNAAFSDTLRNLGIVGAAWIGAAAILALVMAAALRIKDIMAILILGMMIGSGATAIVDMLQYVTPEHALKSFVIWTMGSVGSVALGNLWILTLFTGIGLVLAIALIKPLNLLLLGENYARSMGLNTRRTQLIIFLSTILLAGTVTGFCGPIGFIGIVVPHIARMICSTADHRILMPTSMLLGAVILLGCDLLSQLPGNNLILPINTVTALIGIPIVVVVIVRRRKLF